MNETTLQEIGLSQREIAVYKSLLEIGMTTTGALVKKSKVQNAKIYETLDKLISKGLASFIYKGKVKYFQASPPDALLNFYEERKRKLQDTVKGLKFLQKKETSQHTAKVYEGIRAIKTVFYEMYDYIGRNSEYSVFPIGEQLDTEELIQFWAQVLRKKVEMNIKNRTLPHKKWRRIFNKHYKEYKLISIKYTDHEFPTGIFIFKDHVLTVVWGENPIAFLLKSSENYEKWQRFFNQQWKKSSKK